MSGIAADGVRTPEPPNRVQVIVGKVPANKFMPNNANLSPFMLACAHLNCIGRCRWLAACWRSRS